MGSEGLMEGFIMGKNVETKVNFMEQVAEANVARIIQEEQELEKSSMEIRALKENTRINLARMEEQRQAGNEETRREIRNTVVVDNMRLVTRVLKKYGYFSPDKFQNGCIGLLKAADTFDAEKGVPFPNYAAFCIETEVRMAFKRVNRAFESKAKGFLDSLDEPSVLGNGDTLDRHETVTDPFAEMELDSIIEEAEVDTLFYDIIIPCVEEYGTRAKDIDMEKWRDLEIQYFLELSMEKSQRQRLTFTEMANQLGTTPQNIRVRHKKVMSLIREACEAYGYVYETNENKRTKFYKQDGDGEVYSVRYKGKKHKKGKY
jgi:RNA polymerase sporulation-specific sigma factor